MQGSLIGLLDIHWGDSPDSAKSKLLRMEGVTFVSDTSGFRFHGGSFMGHKVDAWILDFWKGKYFHFARIHFLQDTASAQSLVEDLQKKLENQFGKTSEPRTWRFAVQGEEQTNSVSIFYAPPEPVAVWYGGHGYVDSLERALK